MRLAILAVLLAASFGASATNPPNECGNHGNNCQPENGNGGNSSSSSNATGTGVGIGLGVGVGGSGGNGGAGGAGGSGGSGGNAHGGSAVGVGGSGGDSSSAVVGSGNSHNANTAKGGDAAQGQSQSNIGLNSQGQSSRNDNTNISGSKSIAQMASENSLKNTVNASSANDNRSSASGNQTAVTNNIGGDSTLVERNAPPVFLGAITPTSCGGSFNAGGSSRDGAGGFGFSWVGTECAIRLLGDRYQQLGQVDIACELYSSTKAFKKAAKRNPKLASIDCKAKPATAPAPVLVAPELAPRIPRG